MRRNSLPGTRLFATAVILSAMLAWVGVARAQLAITGLAVPSAGAVMGTLPALGPTRVERTPARKTEFSSETLRLSLSGGIGGDAEDPFRTTFAASASRARLPFPDVRSPARPLLASGVFENGMGLLARADFTDGLYLAAGAYDLLGPDLAALGEIDPRRTDSTATYLRLGYGLSLGAGDVEIGVSHANAAYSPILGIASVTGALGRNRFTDTRVDLGYRHGLGGRHAIWAQASWIGEQQDLSGAAANGYARHASAYLQQARASVSYLHDNALRLTLTAHQGWGSADAVLYAPYPGGGSRTGRPDSRGLVAELSWVPFLDSPGAILPLRSLRFGMLYTAWFQFNGARTNYDGYGRDAAANNLAYAYASFRF